MPGTDVYILAGGQARRFNEAPKGLKMLGKLTLIEHIVDEFKSQLPNITLNTSHPAYTDFVRQHGLNLPVVEDKTPPYSGPLAGLYACMSHMIAHSDSEHLLLCPCDTPFIRFELYEKLISALPYEGMACYRYNSFLEPAFSLWHRALADDIYKAVVEQGMASFKSLITALGERAAIVNYTDESDKQHNPFFNINTEADLASARELFNHE